MELWNDALVTTCEGQSRRRFSPLRLSANTEMLRTACFLCVIGHRELLEHERLTAALALSHKDAEKEQILTLYRRGRITGDDLERQLDTIAAEAAELQGRLSTLDTTLQGQEAIATRLHDAQHLLG